VCRSYRPANKHREAYNILSNPDTRAFYDKVGKDGMKRPEEGGEVDPQEIFGKMFGGGAFCFGIESCNIADLQRHSTTM
jgi:DnaJ-class molecular chaperone